MELKYRGQIDVRGEYLKLGTASNTITLTMVFNLESG